MFRARPRVNTTKATMYTPGWVPIAESWHDIFDNTAREFTRCASQAKTRNKKNSQGQKKAI